MEWVDFIVKDWTEAKYTRLRIKYQTCASPSKHTISLTYYPARVKMEKTITREELIKNELYREILTKEPHHNHPVLIDKIGNIHWKVEEHVLSLVQDIGMNRLMALLYNIGLDKNSEELRKLYRDLGYSLKGYWEIFYWEGNNPKARSYRCPEHHPCSHDVQRERVLGQQK